jgi:hypothetical protein
VKRVSAAKKLGFTAHDVGFYDALEVNGSAVKLRGNH